MKPSRTFALSSVIVIAIASVFLAHYSLHLDSDQLSITEGPAAVIQLPDRVPQSVPDESGKTETVKPAKPRESNAGIRAERAGVRDREVAHESAVAATEDIVPMSRPIGKVAHDIPDQMRVGVVEHVSVKIARHALEERLLESFENPEDVRTETIEVGNVMRVHLRSSDIDGETMRVKTISETRQVLRTDIWAEWRFEVMPVKSGTQLLYLVIAVNVPLETGNEYREYPVLEKEIEVKVNRVWSAADFFKRHWQSIIGTIVTILVAVIGWRVARRKK